MMYLAFSGMSYEAQGGVGDCAGVFSTLDAAVSVVGLPIDYPQYWTTQWAEIYEVRADGLWSVWRDGNYEEPTPAHQLDKVVP